MSVTAASIFICRSTSGGDYGGAFDASYGGTNYANQDAPQATGTASSSGTTVTATTGIFTSAMVGNTLYSGSTRVTITAFTSSTVVTVNTAPALAGSAIGVGGALQSPATMESLIVSSTPAMYSSGTFNLASTIMLATDGSSNTPIPWYGFTATPGDGGKCTFTSSTSGLSLFDANGRKWRSFYNFNMTHTGSARGNAFTTLNGSATGYLWINIVCDGCLRFLYGDNFTPFTIDSSCAMIDCEVKNSTNVGVQVVGIHMRNCSIHGGNSNGITAGGNVNTPVAILESSAIYGNAGDGIQVNSTATNLRVTNCVIRNNTSANLNMSLVSGGSLVYENNINMNAGTYGVKGNSSLVVAVNRNNAYKGNTSGDFSSFSSGTNDVSLSGDPHSNYPTDFVLNSTAGAGLACRGAGYPGVGLLGIGYRDIGPIQHQDSGGGGSSIIIIEDD